MATITAAKPWTQFGLPRIALPLAFLSGSAAIVVAMVLLSVWFRGSWNQAATASGVVATVVAAGVLLGSRQGWANGTRVSMAAIATGIIGLAAVSLAVVTYVGGTGSADGSIAAVLQQSFVGDKGFSQLGNGHHHEIVQYKLDRATQAALDEQLAKSREVANRYPTVADAEAAGYRRAGPYSPGLGAHYIKVGREELNPEGVIDDDHALHPLAIIYDGTEPDSKVAGFMYYSMSPTEPQGFAGPNDVWHYHENICLRYGPNGQIDAPFGADNEATAEQCASVGGNLLKATQWMVHVWSVPGYNNINGGVFAEDNPKLACPDGTYYQLPAEQWAAHPLSTCSAQAP